MSVLNKESNELIDQVIAYLSIPENQKLYDQSTFGEDTDCGTTYCITGIIDILKNGHKNFKKHVEADILYSISDIASSYLHLKDGNLVGQAFYFQTFSIGPENMFEPLKV
jgi:hypothetical protein